MTQIVTDLGIVKCPMNYKTTKKCHQSNVPCIGSGELKIQACINLHICRNVRYEMGMAEEDNFEKEN